ncbi:insulin gene enhancer protein ISL-2 [Lycaon pictus]
MRATVPGRPWAEAGARLQLLGHLLLGKAPGRGDPRSAASPAGCPVGRPPTHPRIWRRRLLVGNTSGSPGTGRLPSQAAVPWWERAGVQAKTLPQPEAPRGGPHRRIRLLPRPWPGAGPGLGVRGRLTVCAGRTGLHRVRASPGHQLYTRPHLTAVGPTAHARTGATTLADAQFPESRLGARPGSWPAAPSAPAPRSVDVVLRPSRLGAMGDPPKRKPGTALCVGCGSRIHDQFLLRVSPDLEWHAACLKCAECSQYLDETCTCFVRDGKTYCKRDYARLFGIKCAKCQVGFSSSDLVMRARDRVYHVECFRCSVCSRQLLPGDEFSLREHELLCRADHGLLLERAAAGSPHSPGPLPGARGLHLPEPAAARQPSLRPHVHKPAEKTTRVRTVLNEKQLHTLRTCYAANPRPDALMKEQLVEMTGLSPRVIRVWFQNKRCKDKKKSILMKQLQQQQHNDKTSLQGLTGTPLVAGSPIRHESAVQGSAVEVQTYQPPWKALSEFALQSDLDQPAFQQLVSFSESGSLGNSSGSDVTSLSSQLPDTPNSMVPSPVET